MITTSDSRPRADDPQRQMSSSWEQRYQHGLTGWDRGQASPALQLWRELGLLDSGRVLVPGCGRGHELVALAALGREVTGLDLAPSALIAAREQLDAHGLDGTLLRVDVLEWQPDEPFDAIYEQTCLCALHPQSWPAYAAQLRRWLKPGGLLLAAFMQTGRPGGPPFDSTISEMRGLFPEPDWHWPDEPQRIEHPSGLHELCAALRRT